MAGILNVPVIRIGNRFYRKNPSRFRSVTELESYTHDAEYDHFDEGSHENPFIKLRFIAAPKQINSSYVCSVDVSPLYKPFIIGKGGSTISSLRNEFKSKITLSQGDDRIITCSALRELDLLSLCRRLEVILAKSRLKLPVSHFISLPVCVDVVKQSFSEFRNAATTLLPDNFPEDMFSAPEKLHFTLSTMVLTSEEEIQEAFSLFKGICNEPEVRQLLVAGPFRLVISGIKCMQKDHAKARVVYASLNDDPDTQRLQELANIFSTKFKDFGISRDTSIVNLHMTLINISNMKENDLIIPFDARPITDNLANFKFNDSPISVDEIHFSVRGSYDTETGYYDRIGSLKLSNEDIVFCENQSK